MKKVDEFVLPSWNRPLFLFVVTVLAIFTVLAVLTTSSMFSISTNVRSTACTTSTWYPLDSDQSINQSINELINESINYSLDRCV